MHIRRSVKIWLCIGLAMLFIQIAVGGITRLTGSGLSITKWEIVTGTVPPLSTADWEEAFALYRQTPQYQKINVDMTMAAFKFIYFWEYIHRLWARLMGFVFLIPFLFFWQKRWLPGYVLRGLFWVVIFAAFAAAFGWIMVASGLVNRPWVDAYKLSIHLGLGFLVFARLLWLLFRVFDVPIINANWRTLRRLTYVLTIMIVLQIIVGGWMSGMKAGIYYPTWPDMHGQYFPQVLIDKTAWTVENMVKYDQHGFAPTLVQFLHRTMAYMILLFSMIYAYRLFSMYRRAKFSVRPIVFYNTMLISQVFLGIMTIIHCMGRIPVFLGVAHQAFALFLLSAILYINYQLSSGR